MCKGAQLTEFALVSVCRECFAEFGFVLLWVVELFDSVMRVWAFVSLLAFVLPVYADFRGIVAERTSSILFMVVNTLFQFIGEMALLRY